MLYKHKTDIKKTLLLLSAFLLFTMCKEPKVLPKQDYTSFVFYTSEDLVFSECVVGTLLPNGNYKKIGDLGKLTKNVHSNEIIIEDESISEIYLFCNYYNFIRFDDTYLIQRNIKNIFEIIPGTKGILVDPTDPKQYPVE